MSQLEPPHRIRLRREHSAYRGLGGRLDPPTRRVLARMVFLVLALLGGFVGSLILDNALDCGRLVVHLSGCG